jgi:hypothetical protein
MPGVAGLCAEPIDSLQDLVKQPAQPPRREPELRAVRRVSSTPSPLAPGEPGPSPASSRIMASTLLPGVGPASKTSNGS